VRRTPLQRRTPLRPTRINRTHPRRSIRFEADAVLSAVERRSRGICELCSEAPAVQFHHRKMKSAGGPDISDNLMHLCRSCHHEAVHANPDWAYRHGLLLRRSSTMFPAPVIGCWFDCDADHLAEM
jgi:hypothetical protein